MTEGCFDFGIRVPFEFVRASRDCTSSNCRGESPCEGFSSVYIIERDFLMLYIQSGINGGLAASF